MRPLAAWRPRSEQRLRSGPHMPVLASTAAIALRGPFLGATPLSQHDPHTSAGARRNSFRTIFAWIFIGYGCNGSVGYIGPPAGFAASGSRPQVAGEPYRVGYFAGSTTLVLESADQP
ncbi:MAG: hypothetical protein AAB426_00875 [Myxococcota bacterium]